MYYHEVGDSRSSLTRDVCQNEIVSGQDWEYIRQNLIHAGEPEFDFDPRSYRVLLTGLPKSVYWGVYGQSANKIMRIFVRLEKRLEALWKEENCRGEIILHLYGKKQILILFTAGTDDGKEETRARMTAETACLFLQKEYEDAFLADGKYRNAAFLSPRQRRKNAIGDATAALLSAWRTTFFDEECRVYGPGEWESRTRPADRVELQEQQYQLRAAVLRGDVEAAAKACEKTFAILKYARDVYLLSGALEELKRDCVGFQQTLGQSPVNAAALNPVFDPGEYAGISELSAQVAGLYRELAKLAREKEKPHGLLADCAMRIVAEHLQEWSLGLPFVAERLGVTSSYLSAIFKRETGMGFSRYVTLQRTEQAKRILSSTKLPVATVASACGFPDPKYFSTCFRKETGQTPQEYQKANRPL